VPCIKLVDWGIAKLTGDAATIAQIVSRTQTGRIFGTPLFMSPEQATGRVSLVGPATDVWALGLVVNRLLTGRDHFESDTVAELIGKISYDPIKPPSAYGADLGAAYDAWFLKCCNREISNRFRSAGEAVTDLALALGIEEGDALIDAVVSSRRAAADMALRETLRAPKTASASTQEIGTIEIELVIPGPPALPAIAPPPVPPSTAPASAGLSKPDTPPATSSPGLSRPSTPAAPPIADVQRPSTPGEPTLPCLSRPSAPAELPSTGPGAVTALARTTFDDEGPRGSTLRSFVVFSVAVVCALAVGLGFGLLFLKGNSCSSGAAPDPSSSAPASAASPPGSSPSPGPTVPASSTNSLAPTASAAPSAGVAPTSPRGNYRGDPLKWRK
jgi:serine/threonine protein kinase